MEEAEEEGRKGGARKGHIQVRAVGNGKAQQRVRGFDCLSCRQSLHSRAVVDRLRPALCGGLTSSTSAHTCHYLLHTTVITAELLSQVSHWKQQGERGS